MRRGRAASDSGSGMMLRLRLLLLPVLLLPLLVRAGPTVADVQSPRAAPLSPKAAEVLGKLDLAGRVGQMLHLSVKKVLFDYPNDPFVNKAKVRVGDVGIVS